MYQYLLISCNQCTIMMQDVYNRRNCDGEILDIWEFSVLSSVFFYKPKTILKK